MIFLTNIPGVLIHEGGPVSEEKSPNPQEALFQQIAERLRDLLPAELSDFKASIKPGDGRLRVRYKQLPQLRYELHLPADETAASLAYFGAGRVELMGVFYRSNSRNLIRWLQYMAPLSPDLSQQMNRTVLVGPWGDKCAFAGLNLAPWELREDADLYARSLGRFIQLTYTQASLGWHAAEK
jgi:hypothetical protein